MSDDTDLSAQHQEHRQLLAQTSALEEMAARVRLRPKPTPEGEGAAAAPATSPKQPADPTPGELTLSDLIVGNQFPKPEDDRGTGKKVFDDVMRGIVETPRALWTGARDAVNNTIGMAGELGDWAEAAGKLPGLRIDDSGIHVLSYEQMQQGPRLADKMKVPGDIEKPKSITGGAIKGVTQFIVGMLGAGKAMKLAGVPKLAGAAGYVKSAAQGAIANFSVFDAHQQRLSNLLQEVPELANPVTEYLASKPDDSAAEGRFKNALEGLMVGSIADGFFNGVKLLRGALSARAQAQTAQAAAANVAPHELTADVAALLGDTTGGVAPPAEGVEAAAAKLVVKPRAQADIEKLAAAAQRTADLAPNDITGRMVGAPNQVASSAAGRAAEPPTTFINFARVESGEDVQTLMQKLADAKPAAADTAKAGARSAEAVKLDATHQNAWQTLLNRRAGEPLSDAQTLAARQLWAASTDKLAQLAQAAADTPSEANLFAFRKMLAVQDVIQREVLGARTATARALQSWKIPAGGGAEKLKALQATLAESGGSDVSRELAARVAGLAKAGMIDEIAAVAEKSAYARGRDAVIEGWRNGLLSAPSTHIVNTISNAAVLALRVVERKVGEKISSVLGDDAGVQAGEAAAQYAGTVGGIIDGFRNAWKSLRSGESGFGLGKVEGQQQGAISSEALKMSSSSWLGRGVDMAGNIIRIPGRLMGAEDEFFKTVGYRSELHAQAVRQANAEAAKGAIAEKDVAMRVAQIIADPPENIRMAAVDAATYQTFSNAPGKLAQALMNLRAHYPALNVILPFVKTPANILNFTFERTPLAPILSSFRQNIAAGGARRDLALSQMGVGTMAMLAFADMTLSGRVSGRGPLENGAKQALRREGWQPYSMRVGDRWIPYNRLDPIGSLVGLAADTTEAVMQFGPQTDDPDVEKLPVATATALAGNMVNKTYLSGLTAIIGAMNEPEMAAEAWVQRLVGSAVPAIVASTERIQDPTVREVYSMLDAVRARVPGLSDELPARRDLWGEAIKQESGFGKMYDFLSPVYSQQPTPEPIDRELLRIGSNITMPPKKTSFDGVTIDLSQYPKAYDRYVQLAGNELKSLAWGKGAKDLLNAIVTDKHPLSAIYKLKSDGPDGGKDVYIRDLVNKYREDARRQLQKEFPDLSAEVAAKKANQRALKMPVLRG